MTTQEGSHTASPAHGKAGCASAQEPTRPNSPTQGAEMKACPFCGSADLVVGDNFVECRTCDADANIHLWNNRMPASPPPGVVEALKGLAADLDSAALLIGVAGLSQTGPHDDETLGRSDGLRAAADMVRGRLAALAAAPQPKPPESV